MLEELFRHDKTGATWRAAVAGVIPVIFQVETVIKRELLTGQDVAPGNDPNMALFEPGFAIRRTAVIKEARRVPLDIPVEIFVIA